jgi:hypothetical protein
MKQTAVDKLLEYFIKEQKEGRSHWCIHDLIAQLYVAKEMEKEQIMDAYKAAEDKYEFFEYEHRYGREYLTAEPYYNETFKQ